MSSNAEAEKKIWAILQAEQKVPRGKTKEDRAAYMKLRRDVQKQVDRNSINVWQFLRDYDAAWVDVKKLMQSEMIFNKDIADVQRAFRKKLKQE